MVDRFLEKEIVEASQESSNDDSSMSQSESESESDSIKSGEKDEAK